MIKFFPKDTRIPRRIYSIINRYGAFCSLFVFLRILFFVSVGMSGFSCSKDTLTTLDDQEQPQQDINDVQNTAKRNTILVKNYTPTDGYKYEDLYAINFSCEFFQGKQELDYSRGGIPNVLKAQIADQFGFSLDESDSNHDGYSDLLMFQAGIDSDNQKNLKYCDDPTQDTDQDGLTDCEENNLLHTDPNNWDTAGDGVPDGLKVRNGLNPLDPNDANLHTGGDLYSNKDKIKMNLPVNESITPEILSYAFKYDVESYTDGSYDFAVTNISLVDASNGNLFKFYFIERNESTGATQLRVVSTVLPRNQEAGSVSEYFFDDLLKGND